MLYIFDGVADALACMRAASTADIMNSPLMAASEQVKMIANAAGIPTVLCAVAFITCV